MKKSLGGASQGHCGSRDMTLLHRNVKRFRGGLAFKALRRLNHSTLGLRVITKKKRAMGLFLHLLGASGFRCPHKSAAAPIYMWGFGLALRLLRWSRNSRQAHDNLGCHPV